MIALRVERRAGLHRLVDGATGRIALDPEGQPLDEGGARRRVQVERRRARLEGEARARARRIAVPVPEYTEAELRAVGAERRRREIGELLERGVLVVKAVDRDRGTVTIGLPPAGAPRGEPLRDEHAAPIEADWHELAGALP